MQERALRTKYKDNESTFIELLQMDCAVTIHAKGLQILTTDMYRARNDLFVCLFVFVFIFIFSFSFSIFLGMVAPHLKRNCFTWGHGFIYSKNLINNLQLMNTIKKKKLR